MSDRDRPSRTGTPPAEEALTAILDDAAVEAAVRGRRAAREGRERARELATWVGTLRDLVEREAEVQVATDAHARFTGRLVGLAADHVLLRVPGGGLTLVARPATTAVREIDAAPGSAAAGDRTAPTDRALLEVLDRWREDAAPVHVVLRGGTTERGRLLAVGEDVVSLATTAGSVHLAADAIVAVTVR